MRRLAVAMVILAADVMTAAPSSAQCSALDRQLLERQAQTALIALIGGNVQQYTALMQAPVPGLSSACSTRLARLSPVRTQCTAAEKRLVLQQYVAAVVAGGSGDVLGALRALEELRDALTAGCWTAVNYPTDPVVLATCSPDEISLLASTSESTVIALRRALATQDFSELMQLAMAAYTSLSAPCVSVLTRFQQAAPYGTGGGAQPGLGVSNVYDHGGGTYSMPGVGACGPSGCVPY